MNGPLKDNPPFRFNLIRNSQEGALMIGIIITIVVLSVLGSAMVYIFSSSALNPISGNFAQQAYYNAESGFRYLASEYRKSATPAAGKTAILAYQTAQTINLPNGTVELEVSGLVTPYVPATATAVLSGNTLELSSVTGTFPSKGFFEIGTDPTVYRYEEITPDGLGGFVLSSISPAGYTGGGITTTEHATITSTGSFGTGFWTSNRKIEYLWALSGFPTGGVPINGGPALPDPQELVRNNPFRNTPDLGRFITEDVGGLAITVDQTTGGKAEAVLGYSANPNPLTVAWNTAGNFLSYDIQVKIATGVWNSGSFDKTAGTPSVADKGYITGLTFRSKGVNPGLWQQYGLAFARYNSDNNNFQPSLNPTGIFPDLISASTYVTGDKGWSVSNSKYYKCTAAGPCTVAPGSLGTGWVEYNPPMILLWTRNSNANSGNEWWLAYKLLEDEPGTGIVDADGLLKDWSTLMLRVVEGASLRFGSSTAFAVGDIVTGAASGAGGKVIKKIRHNTDDIIILNNVSGTFSGTELISSPNQSAIAATEYRPRDNYIWALFGDTDAHATADTTAINDTRRANARIVNDSVVDITNMNCYIHWPETHMADWGVDIVENCSTPQTVKNDYFKLVAWNSNLNTNATNGDSSLLIMGAGKEANAILRTNKWNTSAYGAAFPYEVGFHTLGETATKTFFDDLAINFPGQTIPGGGTNYTPPIQQ